MSEHKHRSRIVASELWPDGTEWTVYQCECGLKFRKRGCPYPMEENNEQILSD
jgi:hypothetical protein